MSNTIEKTNWLQTSTANKAGTTLWALSALLFLLVFINCLLLESGFGTLSNRDGYFTAVGIVFILPAFVLYTILAVGMFTGKNICTVIAKSYGLLLLIMDILIVIFAFIGIKLVLSKIFGLDLFQMISNMLASAREAAGKVDKAALGQYAQAAKEAAKQIAAITKENPEVVNQITEAAKAAGKTLSDSELLNQLALAGNVAAAQATAQIANVTVSPETVAAAKAAAKLLASVMFISIAVPLTQIFTIVAAFLLQVNDDKKSRVVALILWLFMGMFGGHLLYVKRTGSAVVRMVLTITAILAIIPFILGIIDLIKILCGKFEDNMKQPVVDWV